MTNKKIIDWAQINKHEYPKNQWVLVQTSDRAHHIAYYCSGSNEWKSNSKFGGDPKWWAFVPSAS